MCYPKQAFSTKLPYNLAHSNLQHGQVARIKYNYNKLRMTLFDPQKHLTIQKLAYKTSFTTNIEEANNNRQAHSQAEFSARNPLNYCYAVII